MIPRTRRSAQDLIADIEVVRVARTLSRQDAVTGIVDREPGNGRAKRGAQFHALEDEVDAQLILPFHPPQVRTDVVFFANSFFGPLQRNPAFLSKSFHPAMAIIGALTQDFLADGLHLVDVAEKVDDVLGAGEQGQMAQMTTRSKR
jgi:hypothetical protein